MNILENIDLSQHSTMRLGGTARYMVEVFSRGDIEAAVEWAVAHSMPPLMIGGGSNIIWRDEGFEGLLIVNKIAGYEVFVEDETNHYVTIGGGEDWDNVVTRTVVAGLSGIEALALIPGTSGATPIQNVGAYGQQISDVLVSIEAYDLHSRQFVTIPGSDCAFGYRTSRFKTVDRDRYFISHLTLHLMRQNPAPPFYRVLADYLTTHNITSYTPQIIRDAVIDIRSHKLPDPAKIANNGSFFANPVVSGDALIELQAQYPGIPQWPDEHGTSKIPAAWLIEQAGFKDYVDPETGMRTWPEQPLVLVNDHAQTTAQVLKFKQKIIDAVEARFHITLVQEPELLP